MKIKILTSAMALTLLVSCSQKEEAKKETLPVKVTTATVVKKSTVEKLSYSGTIEAFQTIPLNFEGTGTVEKVLVEAGDKVKKGQLLATIDKTDAQNMYEIAKAKQQQAQDGYNRLKEVYEKGSLSEIKWVEMQTNMDQANSSLKMAENNLSKCEMRAPSDGVVGRRNIEPGMSAIMVGKAPIELVELERVYVKISIPEKEIGKLNKGETATFSVGALGNKEFEGTVSNISPVADMISRTYEAKIIVGNKSAELKPGMVCDVNIDINGNAQRLLLPYQCVSRDNDNNQYVYLVDKDGKKAIKQVVTIGQYFDKDLEILSGLKEGDVAVKNGKEKLSNNCLIDF